MIRRLLICVCAAVFLLFLLSTNISKNPQGLQVSFLDVGQGDAIFIETVTGKQVLIDGGQYLDIDSVLSPLLPYYDRSIDVVVATHPDLDHIGGLPTIIQRYSVGRFLHSGYPSHSLGYTHLFETLSLQKVPQQIVGMGDRIYLDEYTYLDILWPPRLYHSDEPNEHSLVMKIHYGNTSAILTGDASRFNEYKLSKFYNKNLSANLLKLGHHGSKTSSSSTFLDMVNPNYAIVSAGCDNTFGHPHQSVVERVQQRNISLYETCKEGTLSFESDGRKWRVL